MTDIIIIFCGGGGWVGWNCLHFMYMKKIRTHNISSLVQYTAVALVHTKVSLGDPMVFNKSHGKMKLKESC